MKQIWKFPLGDKQLTIINMPKGAEIVSCQSQFNEGMLWAIVNPGNDLEEREFFTVGTGQTFYNEHKKYVGTYQTDGGNYVLHVFEIVKHV